MKALAAEIVRKLGKRLRWLSIEVRELTGVFSTEGCCTGFG
jgi:antiviral helicase SLH1